MKKLLADKKLQKIIIYTIAVLILSIIIVLVIIPGVQNSQFSKLKKYDDKANLGKALKRKQQIADSRYYQTVGHIESEDSKIYRIGDFTTNIHGNNKKKLILNISIKYSNSDVPQELKSKNPIIRNKIITVSSDAKQLHTMHGKKLLKKNLRKELNSVISDGEITEIYFNKFLIQ